jgi:hypothetical protein
VATLVLDKGDIRFDAKVQLIESIYSTDNINIGLSVQTSNGSVENYDEVVVTAPLGWLKRNKNCFRPELNFRLSKAIDSISYGNLEKFWISFPTAFWHGALADHAIFLSPDYAASTNPKKWLQGVICLDMLPEGFAQPTLMFYTYGHNSQYMTNLISRFSENSSEYEEAIKSFFEPYYSILPGFSASSPDCQPVSCLATNWGNDELAGYGSYSNYQVGLENGAEEIEVMREGMGLERGIWFAGEHTAPFIASGTVAGAYWSGETIANNILRLYSL